jgi:hypothetical protein
VSNAANKATQETKTGRVTKTYGSTSFVNAADVRITGESADRIQVPNSTGQALTVGASVTVNFVRGNGYKGQITGFAGSASSQVSAANTSAQTAAAGQQNTGYTSTDAPVLLQSADTFDAPNGYIESSGVNINFNDIAPTYTSGGETSNGIRLINMNVLVGTSLPGGTNWLDGTLFDLVDSYSNGLGVYRWNAALDRWVNRTGATTTRTWVTEFPQNAFTGLDIDSRAFAPYGPNGQVVYWTSIMALLHCNTPVTAATSVTLEYGATGNNQFVGTGTNIVSLSVSGSSNYLNTVNPIISPVILPSGTPIVANWTALNGSDSVAHIQFEGVY